MDIGELRSIKDDEIELMRAWRNAPSVRQNMYTRHEIGPEEHREWWERTRTSQAHRYFMYEYQGAPSGIVAFTGIDQVNVNSYWAFYARPDAAKGTGSRMEFLALDYAFGPLGVHKLACEVLAFNTAVIALHKKFGFSVEGVLRQHHNVGDGFVDIYSLGILVDEWRNYRPTMVEKLERFV
jgi:UDP-4-amino-4,6-dideoxy-N-acetyl-beta-L-altrosamine N-acetyltransferase